MGGLTRYVAQRLVLTVPMVFVLVSLVFLVLRIMPGDPVLAMLGGRNVSPELIAQKRHEMGLDKPLHVQYVEYMRGLLRGDLGRSTRTGNPVARELVSRLPATLELAIWGMLFAALFGIPTGIIAAVRADKPADHVIRFLHIGSFALPIFWVGLMFQVIFAVKLGWLPVAGRLAGRYAFTFQRVTGFYLLDALILGDKEVLVDVLKHLVLPGVTLGLAQMGFLGRVTRAAMLEVLDTEYVTTARSKGLAERGVILRHALRNALIPIVTVFGLQFAMLMGGAVLTETVFSWPGVAGFLVQVPRMSQGGFDMFLLGWYPDYLEASNYLAPWTTESPEILGTFFNRHPRYPLYKELMTKALTTLDEDERAKIYQEIQRLSVEDVPWIPLWANFQQAYLVAQKNVKGIVLDLTMEPHLELLYKE